MSESNISDEGRAGLAARNIPASSHEFILLYMRLW